MPCLPRPRRSRVCRHRIASCQSERPRWLRALQVPPAGSSGADFRHLGDLALGWVAHPQGAGACPRQPHRRCRKTNGVGRVRRPWPTALPNGSAYPHRPRPKCSPPKGVPRRSTNRRDARLTERPRLIFPAPGSPESGPGASVKRTFSRLPSHAGCPRGLGGGPGPVAEIWLGDLSPPFVSAVGETAHYHLRQLDQLLIII